MKQLILILLILLAGVVSNADVERVRKEPKYIKVMVIDTGIGLNSKLIDSVQYDDSGDYIDNHGHGTHVAGIVLYGNKVMGPSTNLNNPLCPEVKIYSCKYYDPKATGNNNLKKSIDCVNKANKEKMDYINYSGGGPDFSKEEFLAYKRFTNRGGIAVVSAGNEKASLEDEHYFPASYSYDLTLIQNELGQPPKKVLIKGLKNMYVVENENRQGKLAASSNRFPLAQRSLGESVYSTLPDNKFGLMTGTSQSTPGILHFLLKQRCNEINNSYHSIIK